MFELWGYVFRHMVLLWTRGNVASFPPPVCLVLQRGGGVQILYSTLICRLARLPVFVFGCRSDIYFPASSMICSLGPPKKRFAARKLSGSMVELAANLRSGLGNFEGSGL